MGGGSASVHAGIPPPQEQTPPPEQTPHRADTPPPEQTPQEQTPPTADPSGSRPPRADTPPPPPAKIMLGDTVNARAVRILLECKLVNCNFRDNFVRLDIYMTDLDYVRVEQQPSYTLACLLGECDFNVRFVSFRVYKVQITFDYNFSHKYLHYLLSICRRYWRISGIISWCQHLNSLWISRLFTSRGGLLPRYSKTNEATATGALSLLWQHRLQKGSK